MPWRKIILTVTGWKEGTAIGNIMKNILQKRFYCSMWSDKYKKIYYCHGFSRINSDTRNRFMEHKHCMDQRFSWLVCLSHFYPLLYLLNYFLWLFYSCFIDNSLLKSLCLICLKFLTCVFFYFLNSFYDRPVIQLSFADHLHSYTRLLKMRMIWYKKILPIWWLKNNYL